MRTTARHLLRLAQRNAIALTALFVALAGSSYAAVTINGSQIQNRSINPSKLNPRFINGTPRAWAIVRANGQVITGAGHPSATPGAGLPGEYFVHWGVKVKRCATLATIDTSSAPTEHVAVPGDSSLALPAGYALAGTTGGRVPETTVVTYNQSGQPTPLAFNVAVIC